MTRTIRLALAALLLFVAVPAFAQTYVGPRDYPTVDFGALAPGDPVPGQPGQVFRHTGQGWIVASTRTVDILTTADAPTCTPFPDPYRAPEQAAICSAWLREHTPPPPPSPTFAVGATYRDPYDTHRIVVLAVAMTLESTPVVTAQYVRPSTGLVFAFRAEHGGQWTRVD